MLPIPSAAVRLVVPGHFRGSGQLWAKQDPAPSAVTGSAHPGAVPSTTCPRDRTATAHAPRSAVRVYAGSPAGVARVSLQLPGAADQPSSTAWWPVPGPPEHSWLPRRAHCSARTVPGSRSWIDRPTWPLWRKGSSGLPASHGRCSAVGNYSIVANRALSSAVSWRRSSGVPISWPSMWFTGARSRMLEISQTASASSRSFGSSGP